MTGGEGPVGTAPSPAQMREVATGAFAAFRVGLKTREWQGWFDLLTDDFSFYFPQGQWRGQHHGKLKAIEFFRYVASVFTEGLTIVAVDRILQHEATVLFECRDEGSLVLPGQPPRAYKNRVAISLDVRGTKICGYREYFGSDGASY